MAVVWMKNYAEKRRSFWKGNEDDRKGKKVLIGGVKVWIRIIVVEIWINVDF
jgi:hypothetical protein